MQLKSRDGIACDQCGTTYKLDFLYYSFDFRLVPVHENRRQNIKQIFSTRSVASLDICIQCFEKLKQTIVDNYTKTMSDNVKHRGKSQVGIVCEISGDKMDGTFNYYHCNVVKVDVRMSNQPNTCVKCKRQTLDTDKSCGGCGGTDFIRPAATTTDDRYVEINLSEGAFRGMVYRAESLQKTAGEWATQS